MAVTLHSVYDELQFLSDRISAQIRAIVLSVLALAWLFLAGGKDTPVIPVAPDRRQLLIIALLAVGTLVLDYLQYVMGYWYTSAVRARAEAAGSDTGSYDYKDLRYGARSFLFWFKQLSAVVATGWLICLVARSLAQ